VNNLTKYEHMGQPLVIEAALEMMIQRSIRTGSLRGFVVDHVPQKIADGRHRCDGMSSQSQQLWQEFWPENQAFADFKRARASTGVYQSAYLDRQRIVGPIADASDDRPSPAASGCQFREGGGFEIGQMSARSVVQVPFR
jgi:hypothetical protein